MPLKLNVGVSRKIGLPEYSASAPVATSSSSSTRGCCTRTSTASTSRCAMPTSRATRRVNDELVRPSQRPPVAAHANGQRPRPAPRPGSGPGTPAAGSRTNGVPRPFRQARDPKPGEGDLRDRPHPARRPGGPLAGRARRLDGPRTCRWPTRASSSTSSRRRPASDRAAASSPCRLSSPFQPTRGGPPCRD